MAIFPPTRPPHSHTSSFDSNTDQTIRRKSPETAAESVLDQNISANFPEVVDLALRNKDYIRGVSTDAGIPTPAFRADNRLQQECIDTFVAFEKYDTSLPFVAQYRLTDGLGKEDSRS